jgi:hypothetical protein
MTKKNCVSCRHIRRGRAVHTACLNWCATWVDCYQSGVQACFTGTKVQILTLASLVQKYKHWSRRSGRRLLWKRRTRGSRCIEKKQQARLVCASVWHALVQQCWWKKHQASLASAMTCFTSAFSCISLLYQRSPENRFFGSKHRTIDI